ncbi:phosphoribosyl-ATP pyrophosphatase [Candidatus Zinderia insecticola CARI]|uniref:phosphoribosyl-ATP diphosphatase n=1 Tax=Zinderia insecticola (strain CARI) TaxID=871271 RepID=E0TJ06_ZINIC|nr:phosphoribosyl-ATP pyrophosphatase [Candidatus Zinderia insecticola CARI]
MFNIIKKLEKIIKIRKKKMNFKKSYIASVLYRKNNYILRKISEEVLELILESKDYKKKKKKKFIIYECADLIFHILILLSKFNISFKDILNELKKRKNISGIKEKKNRK